MVSTKYLGRQHMFSVTNVNYVLVSFLWSLLFLSGAQMHASFLQF